MINRIFKRRVKLDRILVQGNLSTVFYIFLFVLSIPALFYLFFSILGFWGLFMSSNLMTTNVTEEPSLLLAVIYNFMDPGYQIQATPGWGRFFAFVLAALGSIFLNGLLISAIVGWYDRFVDKWKSGMARYDEILKHKKIITIIGAHETVPKIIRQSLNSNPDINYILLQTNRNVEEIRAQLSSYLTDKEEQKVIIYSGSRTSKDNLKELHINAVNTMEVFILGDSMEDCQYENNHDALNMNCLNIIADLLREDSDVSSNRSKKDTPKLTCRVMFEYQTSFSIFQYSDISNKIKDIINFKPLNFYELWSQRVLVNTQLSFDSPDYSGYLPLEGKIPIGYDSDDTVHFIIVGMSRMGVALGIEAARLAHYPNFVRNSKLKTRITFIDKNCHTEMKYFKGRFKELFALSPWRELKENEDIGQLDEEKWNIDNLTIDKHYLGDDFIDIEWEFINRGIEDDDVHRYLQHQAKDKHKRLTIAICLPNDNASVAAALYLPEKVYENAIQVLVYQYHNSSVIDNISINNRMNQYYKQLKAFGMMNEAYDVELIHIQELAAQILGNEYYNMYKQVVKQRGIKEIQVNSNRGKSHIAKYWSNVYNANSIWTKLRSIGSEGSSINSEKDIHNLAIVEHNRWVIEQLLMRYRYLTPEEQEKAMHSLEYKEELKGCKMAHLDICSYERLCEVDPGIFYLDVGFIRIIPQITRLINS
ncbi:hypothetical protein [Phocaeicola salanitronis]|uniref:hypothetical protein n=1 Tax=Phocaeicola salanitronis TaxID=376805 RepID=UPI0025A37DDD|nr:hypothetical protein [Phocaeicola salanitronis]MDM8307570.1 hypothetical protein [Phocaeicola salanitronis]